MKAAEIRSQFLSFFEARGHTVVASSPVIPGDDPTLLFTNAGMNQFKDVFLGTERRPYSRAASSQKCIRAGGKHNDLENVGYTARHHTFFEMLGNFSFGDYFKADAIRFAWELLTEVYRLPADKLWVTVYAEDDEAYDIWHRTIGVPAERIVRIGDNKGGRFASDNFWMMGDTGPCGPCTEIFYDHGPEIAGGPPGSADEDGDRYIEIWNNVFMQFNRDDAGVMHPLPKPSVDTGMGLERLAAVLQGVHSNYEIDTFVALLAAAKRAVDAAGAGTCDAESPSLKVIADHIRACSFTIADGVIPGNEGRGYVLRRIARRAIRHGYKLGARRPFLHALLPALVGEMGDAFPELRREQQRVAEVLKQEEERFFQTIGRGMKRLMETIWYAPLSDLLQQDTQKEWRLGPGIILADMELDAVSIGAGQGEATIGALFISGFDAAFDRSRLHEALRLMISRKESGRRSTSPMFNVDRLVIVGVESKSCSAFMADVRRIIEINAANCAVALRLVAQGDVHGLSSLPGEVAFELHDTYGFPLDLTADVCRERGVSVDNAGFDAAMKRQREQARAAGKFRMAQGLDYEGEPTHFHGYEKLIHETAKVVAVYVEGSKVDAANAGDDAVVVLDHTPFYAESGGQVGDTGELRNATARMLVEDTTRLQPAVFGHHGRVVEGSLRPGDGVDARVDAERRAKTIRNHSATHLMHKALREVLGPHVQQKGSLVTPERTRFDFVHNAPLTQEQIRRVEALVNAEILANTEAQERIVPIAEAQGLGAMMLFGEKYGDEVRVLDIGSSRELCGGTHVRRTGDIGLFTIVAEAGVAAGIRRVEAITGDNALAYLQSLESTLEGVAGRLKVAPAEVPGRVGALLEQLRELERELGAIKGRLASSQGDDLASHAVDLNGLKVLAATLDGADAKTLRETLDQLKNKLKSAAIVLASVDGGRVQLAAGVTADRTAKLKAGELVNFVAQQVGGKGGGKAEFAMAGGSDASQLASALASVESWVAERV